MKRFGILGFIAVSQLLAGCDPAITIRQIDVPNAAPTRITIDIKRENPLVGETSYVPSIMVTNSSESPIVITSVELVTKRGTYLNKPRQPGNYPLDVQPEATKTLDVWFDLDGNVGTTFSQEPSELRVHYTSRGRDETVHASVIGGAP